MSLTDSVRDRRCAAGATAARLAAECKAIEGLPVDKIDMAHIQRMTTNFESSMKIILDTYDHLSETDTDEREQFRATQEDLQTISKILTELSNRDTAARLIHMVELMLANLEKKITTSGYKPSMNRTFEAIDGALDSMRIAQAMPGALTCPEIRDMANTVDSRFDKLEKERVFPDETKKAEKPEPLIIKTEGSLRTELLKFDGEYLSWKRWWKRFSTVMAENPHLSENAQEGHLVSSMGTDESRELAQKIFDQAPSHAKAIQTLREHYENAKVLHLHHHRTFYIFDQVENERRSLQEFVDRGVTAEKAFAECQVLTGSQHMTMHSLQRLSPALLILWKKHTQDSKVTPPFSELIEFMNKQIKALGADEIDSGPPTITPRSGDSTQRQTPYASRTKKGFTVMQGHSEDSPRNTCPLCNDNHPLWTCEQYLAKSTSERHNILQDLRLC